MLKKRIFISYKRVDQTRVFQIKRAIENVLKEECWIDLEGIPSDAKWDNEIKCAIDNCEVMVFIRSKEHSKIENVEEDWTYREIQYAVEKGKHIELLDIDDEPFPDWLKSYFSVEEVVNADEIDKMQHLYTKIGKWLGVANEKKRQVLPIGTFKVGDLFYRATIDRLSVEVISELDESPYNTDRNLFVVNIPESIVYKGFEYKVVGILDFAFANCDSIYSVNIPNTIIGIGNSAFRDCKSLVSIDIPNSVISIGDSAFRDCKSLISVNLPSEIASIGLQTFVSCESLVSIDIPNSVISIGDFAFYYCKSLISVNLPSKITSIGSHTFEYCESLFSIDIPNSVTSIGFHAFAYCISLQSLFIPNSVVEIDSPIIPGCTSLESVVVDKENKVYDSRDNCNAIIETGTNTLIAGCSISIIPNTVIEIGYEALTGITFVDIPESVISIGYRAFYGSGLFSVNIPNSVKHIAPSSFSPYSLISIEVAEDNPFFDSRNNCNAIIETISDTLIVGCKYTIIPNSIKCIESGALCGVEDVYYDGTIEQWCKIKFKHDWHGVNSGVHIYVKNCVGEYELIEDVVFPN